MNARAFVRARVCAFKLYDDHQSIRSYGRALEEALCFVCPGKKDRLCRERKQNEEKKQRLNLYYFAACACRASTHLAMVWLARLMASVM
jgi:hypothetical protein